MPIAGTKTSVASKTPSTASKTSTTADQASSPGKASTVSSKLDGAVPKTNVTSRAPWLKDAGKTTSTTQAPWSKRNLTTTPADSNGTQKEAKLQSREIKVPVVTQRKTSIPVEPLVKPKPKEVKVTVPEDDYETSSSEYEEVTDSGEEEEEETESESGSSLQEDGDENKHKLPIQVKLKPVEKPAEVKKSPSAGKFVKPAWAKHALKKVPTLDKLNKPKPLPPTIPETKPLRHVEKPILPEEKPEKSFEFQRPQLRKQDSITKKPIPPPPPPMCPPPPPPPGLLVSKDLNKKTISEKGKETLEKLKSRPRRRPDWSDMMKEVEAGRKLRHVQCNDRSQPILKSETITNIKGQFVFESEKANVHNILLQQIQGGIRLKPTKTNDRSKPVLEGLRKFRKQMTIEEQIQKSESRAQLGARQDTVEETPFPDSADEMDDIDKLRDDLQSTKQMLAQELRNKEAQERENKRLLAKIQNLEAELNKSKSGEGESGSETKSSSSSSSGGNNDALIKSLKSEAEEAQTTSKLLEKKYQDAAGQLDAAKSEVEEQKRKIAELEKKLSHSQGVPTSASARRQSEAPIKDSTPEPDFDSSGPEDDELDDEQKAARVKRRLNREVKYLKGKLDRLKDKQHTAKKERQAIRESMKKNQVSLKDEKKKFKKLQREVDKMAALMKDEDDDDEDGEGKEDGENEKEESEAEDSESEESESDDSEGSDSESEESEPEDASDDKKKINFEPRIKRHEGRLAAIKKGNLLRQANLDRVIDEINKLRDDSVTLQQDLDSVLSELG